MKCLMADDTEMHRNLFKQALKVASEKLGKEFTILDEGVDGADLFKKYCAKGPVDIVFCDIRMPNLDGLSALVKIRDKNPQQKMIMVSSEDIGKMERYNSLRGDEAKLSLEDTKKYDLLKKVAERVITGEVVEGKVNTVLDGCEKLALDPIEVARFFGASGYLKKPYDAEKLTEMLQEVFSTNQFKAIA